MRLLVYCDVSRQDIAWKLGTPEYSYHFVLEAFLPALESFAEVQRVEDGYSADTAWHQCQANGQACILLSFAPPHRTPWELRCPVLPIFAWEYPDLPRGEDEVSWRDDERHDWRKVLCRTGAAISLSEHTATAIRNTLGSSYPVIAAPPPLWDIFSPPHQRALPSNRSGVELCVESVVVDSGLIGFSADGLVDPSKDDGTAADPFIDSKLRSFPKHSDTGWLNESIAAKPSPTVYCTCDPGASAPVATGWELPPRRIVRTILSGVVYTTVLTPSDGRKNWEDLITAFCWAFRDVADATLVLKLGGPDSLKHHHHLLILLTKLSPIRCRVLVMHGYLDNSDYKNLIKASTYYVNASLCEGLCMPLVEFLSSGVPAIAPDHTSMADYMNEEIGFIVESIPGLPALWPHGDHQVFRTSRHQINWHSLMTAYRKSYLLAKNQPDEYEKMSKKSFATMKKYCSAEHVARSLRNFIENHLLKSKQRRELLSQEEYLL